MSRVNNAVSKGAVLAVLLTLGIPAKAGLQEGVDAYKRDDGVSAFQEFKPLADHGNAQAQYYLGLLYAIGQGVPKNSATAVSWIRKAADQGFALAQSSLGALYSRGLGIPQDDMIAASWFRKAAKQGLAEAQFNLGLAYAKGEGVPQDYATAALWLQKAAVQGLPSAQSLLGALYDYGQGVPKDDPTAALWYQRAAELGDATAQCGLGAMYEVGRGVTQDYRKAAVWYRRAAEQGNDDAQYNLGKLYFFGQGVSKDEAIAVSWVRKAADQGHAVAQNQLGGMYKQGQGVPTDLVHAHQWFNLAAANRHQDAIRNREATEAGMTIEQIARSEVLAREWLAEQDKPFKNLLTSDALASLAPGTATSERLTSELVKVPVIREDGVYKVVMKINDGVALMFVVDTGAAEVQLPVDVVASLIRTGTITEDDLLGSRVYRTADGSTYKQRRVRLRSLQIGGRRIENITANVGKAKGLLLLGQTALESLEPWNLDTRNMILTLQPVPVTDAQNALFEVQQKFGASAQH